MNEFYIEVDDNYLSGKWTGHEKNGNELLKSILNVESVECLTNNHLVIGNYLYRIVLNEDDTELLFILRTGFKKIPDSIMKKYYSNLGRGNIS